MAAKLNTWAFEQAKRLIIAGRYVADGQDAWRADQPSPYEENTFIAEHGVNEFGRWYLGIDDAARENTKARYKYPYGDFRDVHRCGVLTAESRAGQYGELDIGKAAAHLHGMIGA